MKASILGGVVGEALGNPGTPTAPTAPVAPPPPPAPPAAPSPELVVSSKAIVGSGANNQNGGGSLAEQALAVKLRKPQPRPTDSTVQQSTGNKMFALMQRRRGSAMQPGAGQMQTHNRGNALEHAVIILDRKISAFRDEKRKVARLTSLEQQLSVTQNQATRTSLETEIEALKQELQNLKSLREDKKAIQLQIEDLKKAKAAEKAAQKKKWEEKAQEEARMKAELKADEDAKKLAEANEKDAQNKAAAKAVQEEVDRLAAAQALISQSNVVAPAQLASSASDPSVPSAPPAPLAPPAPAAPPAPVAPVVLSLDGASGGNNAVGNPNYV